MKAKGKITSVILALTLFLVSVVCPAITTSAYTVAEGECGRKAGSIHWTLSDTGALVISGTGEMANGDDGLWGSNAGKIKTVTINEGVTHISSQAFAKCSSLESISLPASLVEIGGYAFISCEKMKTITFAPGSKLKKVEHGAFYYCCNLEELNFPKSLQSLPEGVFNSLIALKSVSVESGNSYYSSKDGVLFNADKTTLVCYPCARTGGAYTVPYGVKTIGKNSFEATSNLIYLEIPDTVTTFGEYVLTRNAKEDFAVICGRNTPAETYAKSKGVKVLYNDEYRAGECGEGGGNVWWLLSRASGQLTIGGEGKMADFDEEVPSWIYLRDDIRSVKIENGVTAVGKETFFHCENMTKAELPGSVTTIGEGAFYYCTSLTGVTMPGSLTTIGDSAFDGCSSLERLEVREGVTTIGSDAFKGCGKLTVVCIPGSPIYNYCSYNGIPVKAERDCLKSSYDALEFSPKVNVTVAIYVSDVPTGAKVYIDGKEAERENNPAPYYSVYFGRIENLDCKVEVKMGSVVLDEAVIKAEQEPGFFALLSSFFINFLFNGFKWGGETIRFW